MTGRVAKKTILVTGGAGGLGLAITQLAAKEGAAVGVIDIDGVRAAEAAKRLTEQGMSAIGVSADVADGYAISLAVRRVEELLGPIHGLVNNAGVAALGSVHQTDERSWRRIMDVNVNGVFLACKAVLPGMLARSHGTIVNVASVAGLVGIHNMAAYCASKGAVISLTRQLAVDYARSGIRANVIAPGTISSTDMGKSLLQSDDTPEAQARRLAKYPMGRYATADEVAQAAIFLLSDEASFANGSVLTIDGGMTAL